MTLNERDLKQLYQRATARSGGGASCPDAETLALAAGGDLEESERLALADHLAACSDCVAEYRLLAPPRAEETDGEVRPFRPRPAAWRIAAIAASLVLASGITAAVWLGGATDPPAPSDRGAQPTGARVEPADGARLASPPGRLAWEPSGAARRYRVVIFDAESTPVWESAEVGEASLALPDDLRARLRDGRFYWRFTTIGDGGPRESQTFQFDVAP